jgi:hypothetical protein
MPAPATPRPDRSPVLPPRPDACTTPALPFSSTPAESQEPWSAIVAVMAIGVGGGALLGVAGMLCYLLWCEVMR